jgi:5S rRNA maturation endonuclease (ribonuclease M5)
MAQAVSPKHAMHPTAMLQRERRLSQFAEFLHALVKELNDLSSEGAAVLVEGKRDARALVGLGYSGPLYTLAILASSTAARERLRGEVREMIILTDLDEEGRRLASRCVKYLAQEGVKPSLAQRKRLSEASRGIFLQVENLGRFAPGAEDLADLG